METVSNGIDKAHGKSPHEVGFANLVVSWLNIHRTKLECSYYYYGMGRPYFDWAIEVAPG